MPGFLSGLLHPIREGSEVASKLRGKMVASGQQRVVEKAASAVTEEKMAVLEKTTEHLRELDRLRKEQDTVHRKINKIHAKLSQIDICKAEKLGDKLWVKLRGLYMTAKSLAEQEEQTSLDCIRELDSYLAPVQGPSNRKKPDASEQKRKKAKQDNEPARLASPVPSRMPIDHSTISLGDQVAARVSANEAEKDDWIVVKVTRFDRESKQYEVIDEEPGDEEESGQRKYKLPAACVIPFPKRTDPSSAQDFPVGSQVLAVYPGTTALYRAVVVGPARKRKSDDYLLEFDDDEEEGVDGLPKRSVVFNYVVQLPEGHRQ